MAGCHRNLEVTQLYQRSNDVIAIAKCTRTALSREFQPKNWVMPMMIRPKRMRKSVAPMQPNAIAVPVPTVSPSAGSGGAPSVSGGVGPEARADVTSAGAFNRVGEVSRSDKRDSCSAFDACGRIARTVCANYTDSASTPYDFRALGPSIPGAPVIVGRRGRVSGTPSFGLTWTSEYAPM